MSFKSILVSFYCHLINIPILGAFIKKTVYYLLLNNSIHQINNSKGFKFLFFTDSHWGANKRNSPNIIKTIINKCNIDTIVFGGDFITHSDSDKNRMIELGNDFFASINCNGAIVYPVLGNHDDNSYEQTNQKAILTNNEILKILNININNIIKDEDFNYYFDNEEYKIRFLLLNTADRLHKDSQIEFIINSLTSLKQGFNVVAAAHIWYEYDLNLKKYILNSKTEEIISIFDAYNKREKSVDYDFSNSDGRIVMITGGHIHNSFSSVTDSGIPIILFDSDSDEKSYSGRSINGTPFEQCVSVIIIDEFGNNKIINLGR